MKKIEAVIRRDRLGAVRRSLALIGYPGLTVYEVRGHGQQKGRIWADDGILEFLPKCKLEMVVRDADVPAILEAIVSGAHTGVTGDGKIFVSNVDTAVRVRTGDMGEVAL